MGNENHLKIGIPKGSLSEATADLFRRAGYTINVSSRGYYPTINDDTMSCIMFRAQEMSRYVEDGVVDVGITGYDWIQENQSDVIEVAELVYSKVTSRPARWVLAVPEESAIRSPEDLAGGVIATELIGVTKRYFEDRGIDVKVEFSWGATEVKARLVSAIVDVTETGSSLRANSLRVLDEVMISTPRLIANKATWADPHKHERIESLSMLLRAAMEARTKVGLKLNITKENLPRLLALLPSEKSPTLSSLADEKFVAVEVILDERVEREIVPQLIRAGATGLITYPLNKVIH